MRRRVSRSTGLVIGGAPAALLQALGYLIWSLPGLLLHLAAGPSLGAGPAVPHAEADHSATAADPVPVLPFGTGERFVFSIDYGPINAGEGILEIVGMVDYQGWSCYRIESTASSNRFFSGIYRVRDKVVSYMDQRQLFSRYFMKRLREGTFRRIEEIDFDHEAGLARYHDGKQYDVPPGIHDVLSAFYFVRTLDLAVGQDLFLTVHDSRKTYDLRVIVHRLEAIETVLGLQDCFVIQPIMLGEGIFKHEGDMMIYLTADQRRIPVRMTAKLPVGSIAATLREFELAPERAGGDG